MPYRRVGTTVQHKKDGKWSTVPGGSHGSVKKAKAHLTAMRMALARKHGHNIPKKK